MDIKELVNKGISDLSPYEPGKPIEDLERELGINNAIKLASNENPMGPSPRIFDSIEAVLKETHRFYAKPLLRNGPGFFSLNV